MLNMRRQNANLLSRLGLHELVKVGQGEFLLPVVYNEGRFLLQRQKSCANIEAVFDAL
jgi:hypothetical protein